MLWGAALGAFFLPRFAQAQWSELSPYSRVGLGLGWDGVHTHQLGMGSVSSAVADPYAFNPGNPASAAALMRTTFQGSGAFRAMQLRNGEATGTGTWGNTGPMALVIKKQGGKNALQLGLSPLQTTGYVISRTRQVSGVGSLRESYQGEGGLNQATLGWSRGWQWTQWSREALDSIRTSRGSLQVGGQVVYLFGATDHTSRIDVADPTFLDNQSQRLAQFRGLTGELGVQGELLLGQRRADRPGAWQPSIRVGATYRPASRMETRWTEQVFLTQTLGGLVTPIDTAFFLESPDATSAMPARITLGMAWRLQRPSGESWTLYADVKHQDWSQQADQFSWDALGEGMTWGTAQSLHAGLEWSPSASKRREVTGTPMTFRLGYATGTESVRIQDNPLTFSKWTAGTSLPLGAGRSLSRLHFGMEVGTRRIATLDHAQENLLRFEVGVSLSPFFKNNWLVRRLYD